jgi:hypothetical protein
VIQVLFFGQDRGAEGTWGQLRLQVLRMTDHKEAQRNPMLFRRAGVACLCVEDQGEDDGQQEAFHASEI